MNIYKRITFLTVFTILLVSLGIFITNKTPKQTALSEKIQKFDNNYPLKKLFPYRSPNLTADYRLEPKIIYVILKNKISNDTAINEINTYLKSVNSSVTVLKDGGVKFVFENIDTNSTNRITD